MQTLVQDLRYGARMLLKNPGFTLIAVITLALGIGANTAIFSVVNTILLRPLPYSDPERIVLVLHDNRIAKIERDFVSYQNFQDFQKQNQSFERMAAATSVWSSVLTTSEGPERVTNQYASASLFPLLGVPVLMGRLFLESEDQPGQARVVMLSHQLWLSRFASDPDIIGKTLTIDNVTATVVGVMPPGFRFLQEAELWTPLAQNSVIYRGRAVRIVTPLGRLRPGFSLDQARTEMANLARQLEQQYPESNTGLGAAVVTLTEQVSGKIRPALLLLLGVVGFVLLIACANVANLMMTRAATRQREIAVRIALGAGRARLVRQLLTESVTLSVVGGSVGLLPAVWGVDLVRKLGQARLPRVDELSMDGWVLMFTLGLSLLTGILFGLAPALQLSKSNLHESLKEGSRGTLGLGRNLLHSSLIVAEIALALILLTGAGLMLKSFARVIDVDPGYRADKVLTLQIGLPPIYSQPAQRLAFYQQLFARLNALPGVEAAGGATRLPLREGVTTKLEIEGRPVPVGERPEVEFRRASTNYFGAMGIPLRKGRTFTEQDVLESPPVVLINEEAARRFWSSEDPVGKKVRFFGTAEEPWSTIIGVIGNVKHFGLEAEPRPEVYISFSQGPPVAPLLAIRTSVDPPSLISAVRRELRSLEPRLVMYNFTPMANLVTESLTERRINTLLIGVFAALALTLAAIGVYGVMSYLVRQRTHEIGIRMALGAERGDILRLIIGHGMALMLAGMGIGLVGALGLTRVMSGLLFGISPTDTATFAGGSLVLALVTLVACWIPARRATRVDPMIALRYE